MKIAEHVEKKIIPNNFFISLLIFTLGATIFCFFLNDKTLGGNPALIVTGICYFSLGIGLYGIIKSVVLAFFNLVIKLFQFEAKITISFTV